MDTETEKYLVPYSETRTRKSHQFKYRMYRISKAFLSFIFPRSICEWNSMPSEIVKFGSLQSFKIKLANYFKLVMQS